jgi:ribosomal protein L22
VAEEPEKKPRRRRRSRSSEQGAAPSGAEQGAAPDETTPAPSTAGSDDSAEEVEPTASDVEAEEAAADVVLEADDEAEGEAELLEPDDLEDEEVEDGAAPSAPGTPPAASRRRRRSERDPSLPPPVVRAQARYVRSSARKARLVCDHIRGKTVEEARAILAHTPRAIARDWSKLLESAVANAEHNHELVGEDLYVKAINADEGPTIKRFRPRAMGRATRIRKRTSHLTILLTPKD